MVSPVRTGPELGVQPPKLAEVELREARAPAKRSLLSRTFVFNAIMADGVFEYYKGRRKRYLYPGDERKYWAMTTALFHSRIINRMKVEDDLDRLRREGQI